MLTLRKVKEYKRLSQETTAMSCDVLWNGRLFAHARNDGGGGMTMIDLAGAREDYVAAEAYAKQQPDVALGPDRMHTLDSLIDELAEAELTRLDMRSKVVRGTKSKMWYVLDDLTYTYPKPYTPALGASLLAKHPGAVILNPLDVDEAVKLVLEADKRQREKSKK